PGLPAPTSGIDRTVCWSNGGSWNEGPWSEKRVVRDEGEEGAGDEARSGNGERGRREPLVAAADPGGNERDQDRERDDPDGAVDEGEAAAEDRESREQTGDRIGGKVARAGGCAHAVARAFRV